MLTTRHPVDFPYTRPELEALFRHARAHDVEQGGRYDARSAAIILWSHHWLNEILRGRCPPASPRDRRRRCHQTGTRGHPSGVDGRSYSRPG